MNHSRTLLLLATAALFPHAGCGSDSGMDGNYVVVFGAQNRTVDLDDPGIDVKCTRTACTTMTASCACTCDCEQGMVTKKCDTGCTSDCNVMCGVACLDAGKGKVSSASGDCPAKSQGCLGAGLQYAGDSVPGQDIGTYFRFKINKLEEKDEQTLDIDFGQVGLNYTVELGFDPPGGTSGGAKAYRYIFNSSKRNDGTTTATYNSRCKIHVSKSDVAEGTAFSGSMSCIMLWADTSSRDHVGSPLNSFVDIFSRFQCTAPQSSSTTN